MTEWEIAEYNVRMVSKELDHVDPGKYEGSHHCREIGSYWNNPVIKFSSKEQKHGDKLENSYSSIADDGLTVIEIVRRCPHWDMC